MHSLPVGYVRFCQVLSFLMRCVATCISILLSEDVRVYCGIFLVWM